MTKIKARYVGQLRVECEHTENGTKIVTDAPKDNCGKGEAFSPTDLCATALGSCILTTMGIYAAHHDIDITGAEAEIVKVMQSEPRRIAEIRIIIHMPLGNYSEKERKVLERVANACPVHFSLSEQLIQTIEFKWEDKFGSSSKI